MSTNGLYSEGEVILRNKSLLCALHTINEKQRKKKKKKLSVPVKQRKTQNRSTLEFSPGRKSNAEGKKKKKRQPGRGKPESRKVNIHTSNSEKQVCMVVGFLLRRTNWPVTSVRNKDLRCTAVTEKTLVKVSRSPSQWEKWQWHALFTPKHSM